MSEPDPPALEAELSVARAAAERAGRYIAGRWNGVVQVEFKGEVDLVSDVDRAAESIVLETISRAFPADRIIAEEGGEVGGVGQRSWHVDPLDGTTNFSHGVPHFAVSVALVDAEGTAVGVVHDPLRRWTFSARRGGGAWFDGRRLAVSGTDRLDRALLATGFPYDRRTSQRNNVPELAHLIRRCQGVRRMGAAALDLAYVAAGWYDGYWESKLKSWDLAAGRLLVEEAGGATSGYDGGPARLEQGEMIASNGQIHDALVAALAAVQREEEGRCT